MARPLRFDRPNTRYHVLSRGNERRSVFEDAQDYEHFLELLGSLRERYQMEVWAYVLMGNHYHLQLRTEDANLSRAVQWLGVSYSCYYNRKYRRVGRLFQGRFKSFVVKGEEYLGRLLLYVHWNPLRAGVVERLADYPRSSYCCMAYGRKRVPWLEWTKVLGLFKNRRRAFRQAVQEYSEEEDRLLEDLRFGFLLAGERVAEQFWKTLGKKSPREQPQARQLLRAGPIDEQVDSLRGDCGLYAAELGQFRKPIRRRSRPMRDVLMYLLWKNTDYTLPEVGAYFHVGYTTVANARSRGRHYLEQNRTLRRKLKDLLA